jgi:cell division protein FtsB
LYNRVAELIEISESHQKLNGKLQERLTELEEENKKLHNHLNERIYGGGKIET